MKILKILFSSVKILFQRLKRNEYRCSEGERSEHELHLYERLHKSEALIAKDEA